MRFVNVRNDIAFRRIFDNEHQTAILLSFLNAVLNLEGSDKIETVTIIDPYLLPRVRGEKAFVIDVRARDKKGQQFVVEMQVADVRGFDKRVQYYTYKDYASQINRGEQYALLQPTYFIGILDFNFFENPHYLSNHVILEQKTYEHSLKDIRFTFIELNKFNKREEELTSLTDKWIYFIKNAENLELIPTHVEDTGLAQAYKYAERYNWTKEQLRAYDNVFIAEQDARGRLMAAEDKGMRKAKENMVKRCYQRQMPLEEIAAITELPLEDIRAFIAQLEGE
jgi:predicted transposase/invertase (TIGR01784 family)